MHELTIIIFVLVLTIAIVLALKGSRDRATKFQEALLAGFLFFIFASPTAHAMSNSIFESLTNLSLSNENGRPTTAGHVVHSLLFTLAFTIAILL